ncbi:hypothetical protein K708_1716 [Campylobacter coli JL-CDD-LMH]|nr:hypothetical protein K708_1716 [Campylobacter coli JL-CDD-LMH]
MKPLCFLGLKLEKSFARYILKKPSNITLMNFLFSFESFNIYSLFKKSKI